MLTKVVQKHTPHGPSVWAWERRTCSGVFTVDQRDETFPLTLLPYFQRRLRGWSFLFTISESWRLYRSSTEMLFSWARRRYFVNTSMILYLVTVGGVGDLGLSGPIAANGSSQFDLKDLRPYLEFRRNLTRAPQVTIGRSSGNSKNICDPRDNNLRFLRRIGSANFRKLSLVLTPVLSTCPLHTNSGCGKERRILIGPW